jgi:hypothetical protein
MWFYASADGVDAAIARDSWNQVRRERGEGAAMKFRTWRWWALTVTALGIAPAATPALAQGRDEAGLEEIVVTARKREESLQDTPVSLTAFTGEMLEQQQITSLDGVAAATPNLVFDTGTIFPVATRRQPCTSAASARSITRSRWSPAWVSTWTASTWRPPSAACSTSST